MLLRLSTFSAYPRSMSERRRTGWLRSQRFHDCSWRASPQATENSAQASVELSVRIWRYIEQPLSNPNPCRGEAATSDNSKMISYHKARMFRQGPNQASSPRCAASVKSSTEFIRGRPRMESADEDRRVLSSSSHSDQRHRTLSTGRHRSFPPRNDGEYRALSPPPCFR